jgi:two-component system, OmpR family, KDP operon response regulator KdpE
MSEGEILIIGGNRPARRRLHGTLYGAGFAVTDLEYPEDAPALCRTMRFDLILIVADRENREIKTCSWLRPQIPRASIVILSESDRPIQKFKALEAGADDYVANPLHSGELVARIRAIVLGSRTLSHPATESITIGDVTLDAGRRLVLKNGQFINLTPKEFSLLHCLMRNAGSPVLRSSLVAEVWGPSGTQLANLRVLMCQLRMKLGDVGDSRYLLTDASVGYHFVDAATVSGRTAYTGDAPSGDRTRQASPTLLIQRENDQRSTEVGPVGQRCRERDSA